MRPVSGTGQTEVSSPYIGRVATPVSDVGIAAVGRAAEHAEPDRKRQGDKMRGNQRDDGDTDGYEGEPISGTISQSLGATARATAR